MLKQQPEPEKAPGLGKTLPASVSVGTGTFPEPGKTPGPGRTPRRPKPGIRPLQVSRQAQAHYLWTS